MSKKEELLANIDKKIYETSHHPANQEVLPIVLFWSAVAIIFYNPLVWEAMIWGIYAMYCASNNEKWSNNMHNVRERAYLLQFKQDVLNGKYDSELEDDNVNKKYHW